MIDLIQLWINTMKKREQPYERRHPGSYPGHITGEQYYFDLYTRQSSFEFSESPDVFFVKDIKTLESITCYAGLPKVNTTEKEESVRLKVLKEKKAENRYFTDTKEMIITAMIYDESSNRLYMEAKQVPYSFIITLRERRFPKKSSLYSMKCLKAGVLAPLITHDGTNALLRRSEYGLYSFPSGFLTVEHLLQNEFKNGSDFIIKRAIALIKEELLDIGNLRLYFDHSTPKITAVSIRFTAPDTMGSVELITPSHLSCNSNYLQKILSQRFARSIVKDDLPYVFMPLDSQERDKLLKKLLTGPVRLPGASLYLPVALSLTREANQTIRMMPLPRTIPNSSSVAWPLSIFSAKPQKNISMLTHEEVEFERERFQMIS